MKVTISGFYDEVSSNLDEQIALVRELGEKYICPRRVDGKNIADYTAEEFQKTIFQLQFKKEELYRNYAYVEGEISDQEGNKTRVSTIVDIRKNGEELIELYVDARDLQKDEETSNSEYMEMLEERGKEKLAENNKVEEASFAIDPYSNLKYKIDFDLGDKVVYKNDELGFNIENRIVGISEAYENGNKTIDVTFGDEYNLKKIKEVI